MKARPLPGSVYQWGMCECCNRRIQNAGDGWAHAATADDLCALPGEE